MMRDPNLFSSSGGGATPRAESLSFIQWADKQVDPNAVSGQARNGGQIYRIMIVAKPGMEAQIYRIIIAAKTGMEAQIYRMMIVF